MAKFTKEEKLEIYTERKRGSGYKEITDMYGMKRSKIKYLVRLIDQHGIEVLDKDKNRYYSTEFKLEIINRILVDHESINSVAIELGLSSDGTIHSWIKKYKENGYNVIEKKRGKIPMAKPKKVSIDNLTAEEKAKSESVI